MKTTSLIAFFAFSAVASVFADYGYHKPLEIKHVWHKGYNHGYDGHNDGYGHKGYDHGKTLVGYSRVYHVMDHGYHGHHGGHYGKGHGSHYGGGHGGGGHDYHKGHSYGGHSSHGYHKSPYHTGSHGYSKGHHGGHDYGHEVHGGHGYGHY